MGNLLNNFDYISEFLLQNIVFVILIIAGLVLVFIGVLISSYQSKYLDKKWDSTEKVSSGAVITKINYLLDKITYIFPLKNIKANIKDNLAVNLLDEYKLNFVANVIVSLLLLLVFALMLILRNIGQLWYVKILIFTMCLILPYYVVALLFDLYKFRLNVQIPKLIDEFRSAFIQERRIKPALRECSKYLDKGLSGIVKKVSNSTFVEDGLINLKDRFNNVWFNIFVALICNYKDNGGELIKQLYRLNRTMTKYNVVEKKRNKRLIWYEIFVVCASIFSIPGVFWLNKIILGTDSDAIIIDANSNILISKVIGYSIVALISIRVLRNI